MCSLIRFRAVLKESQLIQHIGWQHMTSAGSLFLVERLSDCSLAPLLSAGFDSVERSRDQSWAILRKVVSDLRGVAQQAQVQR